MPPSGLCSQCIHVVHIHVGITLKGTINKYFFFSISALHPNFGKGRKLPRNQHGVWTWSRRRDTEKETKGFCINTAARKGDTGQQEPDCPGAAGSWASHKTTLT